jgi:hypothetical protein
MAREMWREDRDDAMEAEKSGIPVSRREDELVGKMPTLLGARGHHDDGNLPACGDWGEWAWGGESAGWVVEER